MQGMYCRYLFNNVYVDCTKMSNRTDFVKADFENYFDMFLPLNNSEYTEN
jgi:hypothetical protein